MARLRALAEAQIVPVAEPDVVRRVVVDAEEVDRRVDRFHVAGLDQLHGWEELGAGRLRVGAVEHGVEEDPVVLGVDDLRGGDGVLAGGADGMNVERYAERDTPRKRAPHRLHGQAVAEQEMMGDRGGQRVVGLARRVRAHAIALVGRLLGLVQSDPHGHVVSERLRE